MLLGAVPRVLIARSWSGSSVDDVLRAASSRASNCVPHGSAMCSLPGQVRPGSPPADAEQPEL